MPSVHPDMKYMRRCIELASKANKKTRTNPKVGSVLVYQDRIIGEGYHMEYGKPHAEINALDSVATPDKQYIPASTLYVSLEPCSHFGKTPPCAHRIVQEGIKNVVIGCPDPNPLVSGNGIAYLKENGVNVHCPFNLQEAEDLIYSFKTHLSEMPFVILKWAQSADNYLSKKGEQTWLSNEYSRILVHKWRSECDGIMIGKNTALIDKPALSVRLYQGDNPVRIIMDSRLSLKTDMSYGYDDLSTWVFNQLLEAKENNVRYIRSENVHNLTEILKTLFKEGIHTLLVEGGAALLRSFIQAGVWHEARIIRTKTKLGDGVSAPLLQGSLIRKMPLLDDEILCIKNNSPNLHE
jgi:diaminohydroxyphosphoribosylaminopyrimidine deaminase / 5-amino-6-(5-phosphoribosylamino)uracil reductase